jgi:hypothetical protein
MIFPMRPLLPLLMLVSLACSPSTHHHDAEAGADGDVETDGDAEAGADADTLEPPCPANGDFVIVAREAQPVLGASLTYLANGVGEQPEVELTGEMIEGVRTWRFDGERPTDRRIDSLVSDPSASWFGAEFPEASYAEPVQGYESQMLGVYRINDEAVSLLGLASPDDESTLVHYDPPVDVARFPLELARSWEQTTTATGVVMHIAFNAEETYRVTVDAAGEVIVPAGTFPVVRVRTELDRVAGPMSDQRVSYVWIAECWGRVALASSPAGVTDPDFDVAEQFWRLALR